MAALWITVALGVLTAVTGGLAGHLAARKGWHKWAFWGAALISVGLLVVQGFVMQADIRSAEERGRQEQAQLNRIEKNTGQPPTVNVAPPVINFTPPSVLGGVATADVQLDRFESVYNAMLPESQILYRPLFLPGKEVQVNLHWHNFGGASAEDAWVKAGVYITTETEEELVSKFKKELKTIADNPKLRPRSGTIQPGGHDELWTTAFSERVIQKEDLGKLGNASETLYLLASISYRDPKGKHYRHFCRRLQPPDLAPGSNPTSVWQFCQDFADHR